MSAQHLFGCVHPDDPGLSISLSLAPDMEAIYVPLGAGGHVDHLIVRQVGQRYQGKLAVFFYQEYPYSASGGEAIRFQVGNAAQQHGSAAVQTALAAFSGTMQPHLIRLSDADLAAKIAAIRCYQSQISTFWEDINEMEIRVRAYAYEIDGQGAERLWVQG